MCDERPVLIYPPGRGFGETIRLTWAVAGIEFEHGPYVNTAERMNELTASGELLFGQIPLVKYKGRDMVQTFATAKYFAQLAGMMGSTAEETYRISMLADGANDFLMGFVAYRFIPDERFDKGAAAACGRYMPKFEKVLSASAGGFLTGASASFADAVLLNALLNVEERVAGGFDKFPKCKAHLERMKALPSVKAYLASDKRWGPATDEYVDMLKKANFPIMFK